MVTHDDVRRIALSLPETHERASYGGRPSFRTTKQMFTWIRDAPEALVIWVPTVDDRDALVVAEPDKFFTTDHYVDHPIVLVRLEAVDVDEATELITDSWRLRGPKRLVAAWETTQRPG